MAEVGSIGTQSGRGAQSGRLNLVDSRAPSYQGAGLIAAAGAAVAQGFQGLAGGLEEIAKADRAKRDFRALTEFTRLTGEFTREAESLKNTAAPDGSGYAKSVTDLFDNRFNRFLETLEPRQQDSFRLKGEEFKQRAATNAFLFSAEAAEGFALSSLDEQIEAILPGVYGSPSARFEAQKQLAELIEASPLSPAVKRQKALEFQRRIDASALEGTLWNNELKRTAAPFSPESEGVFDAVMFAESDYDISARGPVTRSGARASGIAQVMPDTARDIARELADEAFPAGADDDAVHAYLTTPGADGITPSERYGRYYLNQQLRRFGGDVELALAAYNWGPGNAERWARNGRDPADLPEETRNYIKKISKRLGIVDEDEIVLGGYGSLSFEQTLAARNRIRQQEAQAQADSQGLAAALLTQDVTALEGQIPYFNDLVTRAFNGEEVTGARVRAAIDATNLPEREKQERLRLLQESLDEAKLYGKAERQELDEAAIMSEEQYPGLSLAVRDKARAILRGEITKEEALAEKADREQKQADAQLFLDEQAALLSNARTSVINLYNGALGRSGERRRPGEAPLAITSDEAAQAEIDAMVAQVEELPGTRAQKIQLRDTLRAQLEGARLAGKLKRRELETGEAITPDDFRGVSLEVRAEAEAVLEADARATAGAAFAEQVAQAEREVLASPRDANEILAELEAAIDGQDLSPAEKATAKQRVRERLRGVQVAALAEEGVDVGALGEEPALLPGATPEQLREAKRVVAVQREKNRAAQLVAEREQREAAQNALNIEIDNGGGFLAVARAVEQGVIDAGSTEYDAAVRRVETVEATAIATSEAIARLQDPNVVFTNSDADKADLDLVAAEIGLPAAMRERTPEALGQLSALLNMSGGIVPPSVRETLETMRQSLRPDDVGYAYSALAEMYRAAPDRFLKTFGPETTELVEFYDYVAATSGTEAEAVSGLMLRRTEEGRKLVREREAEAKAGLDATAGDILSGLQSRFSTWTMENYTAEFGQTAAQAEANSAAIFQDFQRAYVRAYSLYNDADRAQEAAYEAVDKLYGMANFDNARRGMFDLSGTGTLVKYPPDKYYEPLDNSQDWVMHQFEREFNVKPGDKVMMRSDAEAASLRVRRGEVPTYNFTIVREDGAIENVNNWYGDIGAEREYLETVRSRQEGLSFATQPEIEARLAARQTNTREVFNWLKLYSEAEAPEQRKRLAGWISGRAGNLRAALTPAQESALTLDDLAAPTSIIEDAAKRIAAGQRLTPEQLQFFRNTTLE